MSRALRILVALAVVSSSLATDQTASSGRSTVDFVGASGKVKLYPSDDSQSFIQVSQSKLQEVDSTGNAIQGRSQNLASAQASSWSAPNLTVDATGAMRWSTSFSSSFNVAGSTVNFVFSCYLYLNDSTVAYGDQTITVRAADLKFSVDISGWPTYTASTNTLNYEIEVSSKGGSQSGSLSNSNGNNDRVQLDVGRIDLPTTVIINGVSQDLGSGLTLTNSNNKQFIEFNFPAFTTLHYDPVMSLDSAASLASPSIALALAAMLVVFTF